MPKPESWQYTPPGAVNMKNTRLHFGVPPELKQRAEAEAIRQEVAVSALLREALEIYLDVMENQ